jgi:uncharacterized protein (DUF305 family)
MKRQTSYVVIAAVCAALFAGPALAQSGDMKDMKMDSGKSMAAPKKAKSMKTAKAGMMKRSCMDYAWESQDAKDCEAGKIKPPTWR